jgi:GT2 family glycosyltransferase
VATNFARFSMFGDPSVGHTDLDNYEEHGESGPEGKGHSLPKVSVILLNLNAYEDTRDCLNSLRRVRYSNLEIILVDNGSTDDSLGRLQAEFPEVVALRSGDNLGFAGGNNLGIEQALRGEADYVLLLNNDTVVDSGFLSALVATGETRPDVGVLGPKIFYFSDPERIWYAGGRLRYGTGACRHVGLNEMDRDGRFSATGDTPFVTGCAMMVKSAVLRQAGLLDARLFVYWEDTDFCSRVTEMGYRCMFVPNSLVWHKVSRTCGRETPFTLYLHTRNHLSWVAKHVPLPQRLGALPLVLARKLTKMSLLVARDRGCAAAVWAGVWAFLRGKYGPPKAEWMPRRQTKVAATPPG